MEVKTIRESRWQKEYLEIPAAERDAVRRERELSEGLKLKIRDARAKATAQLSRELIAKRIVYLVVRLDFTLDGRVAVLDFVQAQRSPDVEVHFHWFGQPR